MKNKTGLGYGLLGVLLFGSFCVSGCGNPIVAKIMDKGKTAPPDTGENTEGPPHTHQWGAWAVTSPAACTAGGVETRLCALDPSHIETKVIAALGHNWQAGAGPYTPATCTVDGYGSQICTRCEETKAEGVIPALGHDYNWEETTTPTCEAAGVETGTCIRDSLHTSTRVVAALGHDWEWMRITAPTATKEGKETGTCKHDPSHTDERAIPPTGVKANPEVTWPTGLTATYGQTLSEISLSGKGAGSPAGTFVWTTPGTSVGNVGTRSHSMTFTPNDDDIADYNPLTQNVPVTVAKAAGVAVSAPSAETIGANSVTLAAVSPPGNGQVIEYARSNSTTAPANDNDWKTDRTFTGLTAGTTWYFFARSASHDNYNAGAASAGTAITTKQQVGDNIFVSYWVDDAGELSIGRTDNTPITNKTVTVTNGGSVTFSAAATGYTNHSWTLNGNNVGTDPSYTFDTSGNEKEPGKNYTVGLTVQKDGNYYYTQITVRIEQ